MMRELELYFHIPFCVKKCLYCDLLSAPASKQIQEQYMEAMISGVTKSAGMYRNYRVETIFFGGGTPSLPDAAWMEKLMDAVKKVFSVSDNAEITIECNPGTTTEEKLCTYRKAGINRISFGLQSANEEELRSLGRIHN